MKPLDWPLLADENIHPEVVSRLRATGKHIRSVHEEGLAGASDLSILRHAHQQGRVVLTHDSDFGTLAVYTGEPYVGIVYLRPGNILASVVLEVIGAIETTVPSVDLRFIVVAERRDGSMRIRVRSSA